MDKGMYQTITHYILIIMDPLIIMEYPIIAEHLIFLELHLDHRHCSWIDHLDRCHQRRRLKNVLRHRGTHFEVHVQV